MLVFCKHRISHCAPAAILRPVQPLQPSSTRTRSPTAQDEIQCPANSGCRRFTFYCFSGWCSVVNEVGCTVTNLTTMRSSGAVMPGIGWTLNAPCTRCRQTLWDAFVLAFNREIDNKAGIINVFLGFMFECCGAAGICPIITILRTKSNLFLAG